MNFNRTKCVVCSSNNVAKEPFFYNWNGKYYWIMRCAECSHQFVFPFITEQDQKKIYSDQYFSKNGEWVCGIFDDGYISAESNLREEAQEILHMLPIRSGRLLEIGSAAGYFLDEARKVGFDVVGIELNQSMVDHARNVLDVKVHCQRIEDIPTNKFKEKLDVSLLLDVLEHLPFPALTMQKVQAWMRPGGFLLIRGPMNNDPIAKCKEAIRRMLRINKQLPGYPLDVNWFTKKSLTRLLNLCRFEIIKSIDETRGFANILARRF